VVHTADIIVVGAGIAGSSAAAELAAGARVVVLEMEPHPGYHATGRSAAYFAAAYGKKVVRELTGCCESFFRDPPDGFSPTELLRPRDSMYFARADQLAQLESLHRDNPELELVGPEEVLRRVPVFTDGYLEAALWEGRGGDLDVEAILQGYLRLLRRRQGQYLGDHQVTGMSQTGQGWRVAAGGEQFEAAVVVNAAGAWADRVSQMAGLEPLGIRPLRRTAMTVDPPAGIDISEWPNMIDAEEHFYFKPEAGRILISPADETPSEPCDAQPEELDIALGVDRFERATGIDIHRVCSSWAGLRTFAPDRLFVAGYDPRTEGFFWLAGQGGYGIQSAPALAQLSPLLIKDVPPEPDFARVHEHIAAISPVRLLASGGASA
jgi:D-arginine dehydrogenase